MEKMKYEQVMKIRFINTVCILALILASACKSDNTSQPKIRKQSQWQSQLQ